MKTDDCTFILYVLCAGLLLTTQAVLGQEVRRSSGRAIPGDTATPTATATQTPTPDPDPCADCIEPGSFWCEMFQEICYACWDECGNPQATPTPTRPPTPTPTATHPPTPTPSPGECRYRLVVDPGHPKEVYAIAYYIHEGAPGVLYRANPPLVREGDVLRAATEGHPVAIEWYVRLAGGGAFERVSTCGAVPLQIFSDGFETGDTSRWTREVDDG